MRTAGLVLLVVLVVVGVLLATGGDDGGDRPAGGTAASTTALPPARSARTVGELRPARVLRRVEELRGLRLRRPPRFRVLTPDQARRQVRAAEDREAGGRTSAREDRVNASLVTLLGLLPPDLDLEELAGRITSEGTLGYYDGDRNEMVIISKGPTLPVGVETTVAHELTHAIDDEHFGVFRRVQRLRADGDAELAYRSVVEGNASDVEERYRVRYRIPQPDPAGDREQQRLARDLPFGLRLQLGFPYAIGEAFVGALRAGDGGGDALVDRALGDGRPRTSVEILDPTRWVQRRPTVTTPLRPGPVLGDGWTALDADDIGAADVLALLAPVEAESGRAALVARAWTGGAYRFLRRGGADPRGCEDPCRTRDAVVGSVAFTTAAGARAYSAAFGRVLERYRAGTRTAPDAWRVGAGGAAVRVVGARATFAYAPTSDLATRLVRDAPPR